MMGSWLFILLIVILGLAVGSFLNVVIGRLPQMLEAQWQQDCETFLNLPEGPRPVKINLMFPHSYCPQCKTTLKWWHNIPLISFLILKGRCAFCHAKICYQYPLIEAGTAILSGIIAVWFGPTWLMLFVLVFTWVLIAAAGIDAKTQLLPDELTMPLLWLGLLVNINATIVPLSQAVLGAALGYGVLWSIYWLFKLITGKEGMGYGDFKLLAALGAWMGWTYLPLILLLAALIGLAFAVLQMIFKQRWRSEPMAFGPSLALAGWITLLWGPLILSWYL